MFCRSSFFFDRLKSTKKLELWRDLYGPEHTYARVRDVAEQSLGGLAEALRCTDFTALKETNDYVREQEREAGRSAEKERDIGIDRERGYSL